MTDAILREAPRLAHARVPPAIAAVLARALAKEPAEHIASALEMRSALAAAAERA